jgi:carbon-monoxide dehydrogenase medium subunit
VVEAFEYCSPRTVDEALTELARGGPDARILAGGQSLLILLRQRLVTPSVLVSLKHVEELQLVERREGSLRLGSMTTYRATAGSSDVGVLAPVLAKAAGSVGSIHIRNLGTVGGSLCHADPAGDVPTVLQALDAELETVSSTGTHSYPANEFFSGLFETRLEQGEVLRSVAVPMQPDGATFGYRRFSFREGEYPMAVAACRLEWGGEGCTGARVAIGGGDLYPRRYPEMEESLTGTSVDDRAIASAIERLREVLRPMADVRGSAEWKMEVISALAARTVSDAVLSRGVPDA